MKNKNTALIWVLGALSGVLMSLPFLIPHCGWISLFAIVPLLCAERIARISGKKRFWLVHYCSFLIFNALTTFWVCNATVGGGIFACVANAFQMSVVFALFRLCRRYFKGTVPYIFLMVTWIAWERAYFSAQISWPWLVLGNSFARSIKSIQWYEYTGVLGGSLWIWLCNLGIFGLMVSFADEIWFRWNLKARIASVAGLVLLVTVPFAASSVLWRQYEQSGGELDVAIFQPNIDPYHKFEFLDQRQQNDILLAQMNPVLEERDSTKPLLLLAPETFTNDVRIMDGEISSRTLDVFKQELSHFPGTELLFGASSYEYFRSGTAPSPTARKVGEGYWVESHNSALLTDGQSAPQIYQKSRLVVAVEMTPYPKFFCKIDDMLGGVMGRCIGQAEAGVLKMENGTAVAPVICYESVYGEYCTEYVRKGADMLAIITNDAWWKDTPGYRQHLSYASLRAIETRRWIARSANTGISAIIDDRGRIVSSTDWWEKDTLRGQVRLNERRTFFVEHGDICGRVCTMLFLLLCAALAVRIITSGRQRE